MYMNKHVHFSHILFIYTTSTYTDTRVYICVHTEDFELTKIHQTNAPHQVGFGWRIRSEFGLSNLVKKRIELIWRINGLPPCNLWTRRVQESTACIKRDGGLVYICARRFSNYA